MKSSTDAMIDKVESCTFAASSFPATFQEMSKKLQEDIAAQDKLAIEQKSAHRAKHHHNSAMIKELKRDLQRITEEEAEVKRRFEACCHRYTEKTSKLDDMLKILVEKEDMYDMLLAEYVNTTNVINNIYKETDEGFTIKEAKLMSLDFDKLLFIEELNQQYEAGEILDAEIRDWLKQFNDFPMADEASTGIDEELKDKEGEVAENADGSEHDDPPFETSKA